MTIAEVAKKYDLSPDTLRYYERVGLLPEVGRTPGGIVPARTPSGACQPGRDGRCIP